MTKVLVTGGSGFLAAHIVDILLKRGHTVVTTVRSADKGDKILAYHSSTKRSQLDYAIVEDISKPGAFDTAVVSDPPFEAVIHAASPYHFNAKSREQVEELVETAHKGTVGILEAVKAHAPGVKRVVVTSSFAAIVDPKKLSGYTYSEKDWCPITREESFNDPASAYRFSKTQAEKAAWEFVDKEKPHFTLTTCNPPLIFGPIIHHLTSLDNINTSNIRLRDMITGAQKSKLSPTGNYFWVDVRDIATAHALAIEKPEAAGKRFFVTKGPYNNVEVVKIIGEEFPEYREGLPSGDALKSGDYPAAGPPGYDNSQSIDVLGVEYCSLKQSIVDTVKSLQPLLGK